MKNITILIVPHYFPSFALVFSTIIQFLTLLASCYCQQRNGASRNMHLILLFMAIFFILRVKSLIYAVRFAFIEHNRRDLYSAILLKLHFHSLYTHYLLHVWEWLFFVINFNVVLKPWLSGIILLHPHVFLLNTSRRTTSVKIVKTNHDGSSDRSFHFIVHSLNGTITSFMLCFYQVQIFHWICYSCI